MKRRTFIKGAIAVPVALSLPALPKAEPVLAYCDYREVGYTIRYVGVRSKYGALGDALAKSLANSMRQTMEQTAANIFSRAFEIEPIAAVDFYKDG